MMMLPTLVLSTIVVTLTLQSCLVASASGSDFRLRRRDDVDVDNEPCDDSFPLAPASSLLLQKQPAAEAATILKVAVPTDPTGRSYAPVCPDGRRIDIRRLEKCAGATCWVASYDSCFHSTSYECQTNILPVPVAVPSPTRRPTFPVVETVHPVQLVLKDVPFGYRPSLEARSLMLRFIREILEEDLESRLELIKVEYAGRIPTNQLDASSIPLRITVRGPTDISDFALSYIKETIRDRFDDLAERLRQYGESLGDDFIRDVFANAKLSARSFKFDDILVGPGDSPTSMPISRRPTRRPSNRSTGMPTKKPIKRPARRPTLSPMRMSLLGTVETMHRVQLFLRNVPPEYRPSPEARSLILSFVALKLAENLDRGLYLIKVEYAGGKGRNLQSHPYQLHQRQLDTVSIPMLVTVSGPADLSGSALSYIMETIQDHLDDLAEELQRYEESLDRGDFTQNAFDNIELSAATYKLGDIATRPTDPLSSVPTTTRPSMWPTRMPSELPSGVPSKIVAEDDSTANKLAILDVIVEETVKAPWWVWLIIALAILLCCIYCVCCCRIKNGGINDEEEALNIWIQSGDATGPRKERRKTHWRRPERKIAPDNDSAPRKIDLWDGSETSRRTPKSSPVLVRPSVKRRISQTEREEKERGEREFRDFIRQIEPEEESRRERECRVLAMLPIDTDYSKNSVVELAVSVDPMEENVVVPYNFNQLWHHEENRSRNSSVFADPLDENVLVSHNSNRRQHPEDNRSYVSEEPEGFKATRTTSMYASELYSSPAASDDNRHQKPRRAKIVPRKDTMFLCSWGDLREEVRSKSTSRACKCSPGQSCKKKRKSKKTYRTKNNNDPSGDDTWPQDVSLDIFLDKSVADRRSISHLIK